MPNFKKNTSPFQMKGSPYKNEKKGLRIPGPKETVKVFGQSLKHMWKKYGPTINPSTKNPKGIGK